MDYITRNEYDACRSRCTDRCGACQEGIKESKLICDKRYDYIMEQNNFIKNDVNDLRIGMSVNNFKWAMQAFIGSFIAGILTIVAAAALISYLGIATPQITVDDNKTSIIIPYEQPTTIGAAYADEVAKNK